jgi:hypothetical protein
VNPQDQSPIPALTQMITGGWVAQSISVAARLGIADLVSERPQSVEQLAAATSTHVPSLARLLRALASLGIFARDESNIESDTENGNYRNTPLSEYLRSGTPESVRAMAAMMGEEHWVAWGNLFYSIQTGETAFDHVYGENFFEYVAKHPEASKTFNDAMTAFASTSHSAIVGAYDFSGIQTLCDVGGGHGTLLALILKANPNLRGVLFDLPHVVAGAPGVLARHGVAECVEVAGGDFFQEVPSADAYIMSHIIHDWDDERAVKILQSCRRAVNSSSSAGGKVLLVEMVVPEGDAFSPAKWMDLNMLAMTPGGRERTEGEYSVLLQKAGYELKRVVPSQGPVSVIEGIAV